MSIYSKINDNTISETKEVVITYDLEQVREEKKMAEEHKQQVIADTEAIISKCDAILLEAEKLTAKTETKEL